MPADLCNFEVIYPGRVRLFHCGVWSMRWDSLLILCECRGHELELRQSWHSCCPPASVGTLAKDQLRSQGGRGLGQASLQVKGGAPPSSLTPPPASTHHPQPPSGHQQALEVSKIPATPSHLISATLPHHLHLSASIHPYFFISKTQASGSPEEPSPWLSGVRSFLHQFVAGMRQQLLPSSLFFPTRALEPHGPIFKSLQSTGLLPSSETLPVLSPGVV